jgi:hypothetical protein
MSEATKLIEGRGRHAAERLQARMVLDGDIPLNHRERQLPVLLLALVMFKAIASSACELPF